MPAYLVACIILYGLLETTVSFICNRYVFYLGRKLYYGVIHNVLDKVSVYLSEKDDFYNKELSVNISKYWLKIYYVVSQFTRTIASIVIVIVSSLNYEYKLMYLLLIGFIAVIVFFAGKQWNRISDIANKLHREERDLPRHILVKRIISPVLFNLTKVPVLPVLILFSIWLGSEALVIAFVGLQSTVSYAWVFIYEIERLITSKRSMRHIITSLKRIEKQYVINSRTFKKLCNRVRYIGTNNDAGLVLNQYAPRSISTEEDEKRRYSVALKQGLYQLKGFNGVGKTTLLKSLALPAGELTEYSEGGASFFGEAVFNSKCTLQEHRERYKYIGSDYKADVGSFDVDYFQKYPTVYEFLQNYINNVHTVNSEGESAILAICTVYYELKIKRINVKAIFIDEIISRVYSREDFPLREEVVEMIEETSKERIIVIVVDHAHKLSKAQQLLMFTDGIEYV